MKPTITSDEGKALFFAPYLNQIVSSYSNGQRPHILTYTELDPAVIGYKVLLLRSIEQLTDEELAIIDQYNDVHMRDIMRLFGVIVSFTYLDTNNTPITLSPSELVNRGWCKIKTV